jgi:uncharacterized caspase-like protein
MMIRPIRLNRRSMLIAAAAFAGLVSLGLGAHAALHLASSDADSKAKQVAVTHGAKRLALVIGNGHYPDAGAPLAQPINDARTLARTLRDEGFEVEAVEDGTKADMQRAVDRLTARITPDTVVTLFFGGYGIQSGRESYMIPVDAVIWKEADIRRNGISIESVLAAISGRGAKAKFAVIDASRRNPYERRFRQYSHGLAPINAPANALILSSATPGKVVDEVVDDVPPSDNSVLVSELLEALKSDGGTVETVSTRTRNAVSRRTNGAQVPSVSSSLLEDIRIKASTHTQAAAGQAAAAAGK